MLRPIPRLAKPYPAVPRQASPCPAAPGRAMPCQDPHYITGDAIRTIELLSIASLDWDRVIVTTGVGSHQSLVCRHFAFDYPRRRLITSAGHGTMGTGIPYAIGAQFADPEALVLCIDGDGSACMDIMHMATAAEYRLPVKVVVLDNNAMGIVAQFEGLQGYQNVATADRRNPPFGLMAGACGCFGYGSDETASWELADWQQFLSLRGPALAHVLVDDYAVWPILEGGRSPGDMTHESQAAR